MWQICISVMGWSDWRLSSLKPLSRHLASVRTHHTQLVICYTQMIHSSWPGSTLKTGHTHGQIRHISRLLVSVGHLLPADEDCGSKTHSGNSQHNTDRLPTDSVRYVAQSRHLHTGKWVSKWCVQHWSTSWLSHWYVVGENSNRPLQNYNKLCKLYARMR